MEIQRLPLAGALNNILDDNKSDLNISKKSSSSSELVDHNEKLSNIAEELADSLSSLGRTSKIGRKNDSSDNDTVTAILEENADEKIFILIKQISKFQDQTSILNYARQLFPNEWDLLQALREMLLSRKLSDAQKRKVKEALVDLNAFGDRKKIQSSANVGGIAKQFSKINKDCKITAKDLRNCYLRFLELEVPATYLYQDWIHEFGFNYRKRVMLFIRTALIADMKASVPGIHLHEFGPLSTRHSDVRILRTLDLKLTIYFRNFSFSSMTEFNKEIIIDEYILNLYITGLINVDELAQAFNNFKNDFMSEMPVNRQATVVQIFLNVYNNTPDFLYANLGYHAATITFLSTLLDSLHRKERNLIIYERYPQ
ncbi:HrpJ domain-containing protein [Erwinia amylovora]|uniref:HrpJ domain-containing protein n=1 Tax=Erwinia amylovora TaxID=552 RepID=UPI001443C439|nr:HrpJ domain-containing protein [Erwinia amylovora]